MDLYAEFESIVKALDAARIQFAVCGGFAMAVHGVARATKDIDLLVPPEETERIIHTLKPLGFELDCGELRFDFPGSHATAMRRIGKVIGDELLQLDLVQVSPVFEDVWAERQTFDWKGRPLPAVSARGLAKMKLVARRAQDLADIQNLGFTPDDPSIQP